MSPREIAEKGTILRGIVGSAAYGLAVDGVSDRDEMGVCIEPPEYVAGLGRFEQYTYRNQPSGERSGAGDLDLTIYSLRKFCRLAAQGNPSILTLLYLPETCILSCSDLGRELIAIKDAFISREAGCRFLGYLRSQLAKLRGERSPCVSRPELVAQFGYDTKFAAHAVRLGLQGVEYLLHGRMSLPMADGDLQIVRTVRNGEFPLADAVDLINNIAASLCEIVDGYTKDANVAAINDFLVSAHLSHWAAPSHREGSN